MAVDRTRTQAHQRLAALSRTERLLRGLFEDIELQTLQYDVDTKALLVEYSGGTSDAVEGFHERVVTVALACTRGLQSQDWPTDVEQVIGVAHEADEIGFKDAHALRWRASIDQLKRFTTEDVTDLTVPLPMLENVEALYVDGRSEKVDLLSILEANGHFQ